MSMIFGHPHADSIAILRETTPGTFEVGPEGSPFPMKVELSVPGPGWLRHVWRHANGVGPGAGSAS
jgi:hypothetical protein